MRQKIHQGEVFEYFPKKDSSEHGRDLNPKPQFLVTAEAYLATTYGPNISDFYDLSLHWVFVVHE